MAISRLDMERQLRKMGGRIGLQEGGGIEQRLEQLGGDVSSAEEMLQAINQRLQTAESGLGGGGSQLPAGGLGTLATLAGSNQPFNPMQTPPESLPVVQPRPSGPGSNQMPPGFGTRPLLSATIDPNFKPVEELKSVQPGNSILNNFSGFSGETFNQVPEEFRSGFAEYTKENPIGMGGQAMSSVMLPDGNRVMFGDTGSAGSFRNYLKSTGFNPTGPLGQPLGGLGGGMGSPLQTALGLADGGIASLQEPRQGYFLGKLVKKAKRAVKKVVKSPIGKAAILAAPFLMGGAGAGGLGSIFGKAKGLGSLISGLGSKISGMSTLGKLGLIGGASGLAGLMTARGQQEEDDEEDFYRGEGLDIADIIKRARMNDSEFRFLPGAEFTGAYAKGGEVDAGAPEIKVKGDVRPENMKMADKFDMDDPMYKGINPKVVKEFIEEGIPLGYETPEDYFEDFYGPIGLKDGGLPSGIMNLGGMEMDLRGGGFVPLGAKEKADDVPARLSKNEFVMTADAVRAAGGGSVDKGADKMYKLMKGLEAQV